MHKKIMFEDLKTKEDRLGLNYTKEEKSEMIILLIILNLILWVLYSVLPFIQLINNL